MVEGYLVGALSVLLCITYNYIGWMLGDPIHQFCLYSSRPSAVYGKTCRLAYMSFNWIDRGLVADNQSIGEGAAAWYGGNYL